MVRRTGRLAAASIAFLLIGLTLNQTAIAGQKLTRNEAIKATSAKMVRVSNSLGYSGFKVSGCTKRGRMKAKCFVDVTVEGKSDNGSCRLVWSVRKSGKRKAVDLRKSSCAGETPAPDPPSFEIPHLIDPENPFQLGPGAKFCPGTVGSNWDARRDLIGKTFDEAVVIAESHGCSVRPVIIDGENQIITMDFRYNRINVSVEGPEQRIIAIEAIA